RHFPAAAATAPASDKCLPLSPKRQTELFLCRRLSRPVVAQLDFNHFVAMPARALPCALIAITRQHAKCHCGLSARACFFLILSRAVSYTFVCVRLTVSRAESLYHRAPVH